MTVDTFETRRPETSPKVTTILGFATTTPPILVTVDTFETRRPETSPKVTTVLGFATTTPPILVTVDTFVMRDVKSDDSSAFRDDFRLIRLSGMSDPPRTLCGRFADALRTLADALRTQRNDLASPPGPLDPNFKTGTLLLRIREKEILVNQRLKNKLVRRSMQKLLAEVHWIRKLHEPHVGLYVGNRKCEVLVC